MNTLKRIDIIDKILLVIMIKVQFYLLLGLNLIATNSQFKTFNRHLFSEQNYFHIHPDQKRGKRVHYSLRIAMMRILKILLITIGVILGAAYMLWLYKRVVFGKLLNEDLKKILDLNRSEYFILSCLAAPILFFGFYPDPLINTIEVSVTDLINMHNTNIASK